MSESHGSEREGSTPTEPGPPGPGERPETPPAPLAEQPWLHDLEITVLGTVTCVSTGDGDLGDEPATGLYVDDQRVLSDLRLRYDGHRPVRLASHAVGSRGSSYLVARALGPAGPDPTVTIRRRRVLRGLGLTERLMITSASSEPVTTTVTVTMAGDGLDLGSVKAGAVSDRGLPVDLGEGEVSWSDRLHRTRVTGPGSTASTDDAGRGVLGWAVALSPGGSHEISFDLDVERLVPTAFDASSGAARVDWSGFRVAASDRRLDLTVATAVEDLVGLLQTDPLDSADVYAGAGSPWYLTLFGRDSIWTARFGLPLGTELALGTLRALARRQGRRLDPRTAEEPGKIVHEVRRTDSDAPVGAHRLPPVYYGTVDATPLWVVLLHEAWRWGAAPEAVAALRPALDGAVDWLRDSVEASPDGLLRYNDPTGEGLSNQGWKDSHDAMRFRDGRIAESPIALLEVQGYAVQAARAAAELREELFGEAGDGDRAWAEDLEKRVRAAFWVEDELGAYPAMALDRHGAPVDGVASNMGHALGSGVLSASEGDLVADRLTGPDLLSAFGTRTLSRDNPAYNPIGYHTGSVWVHDATICATGLATSGHDLAAGATLRALLEGAMHVDFRLPELYGAEVGLGRPAPYPASCRPQAWSAASAVAMATAALGIRPDVPHGRVVIRPLRPAPFGAMTVSGIRVGDDPVTVSIDADGGVVEVDAPASVSVETP